MRRLKMTLLPIFVGLMPVLIFFFPILSHNMKEHNIQNAYSPFKKHDSYPRVVVSLSTIPERLPFIQPTLESLLLHQTLPADAVYLVLPEHKFFGTSKDEKIEYTFPDFLTSPPKGLIVSHPKYDYGPISKILPILSIEEDPSTRIIYVDDDVIYEPKLLELLVKASLSSENQVIAMSGAKLRSNFRQIKHTQATKDKFPNLFFHMSAPSHPNQRPLQVDIVQGFAGVCITPFMISHSKVQSLFQSTQQSSLPLGVMQSDDFILSAVMEWANVTRVVIPGGSGRINISKNVSSISPLSKGMHNHAMEAAYYLQQRWNIWSHHTFLNPNVLSQEQREAIDCEASYEQDCISSPTMCRPNGQFCPKAEAVLKDLVPPSLVAA